MKMSLFRHVTFTCLTISVSVTNLYVSKRHGWTKFVLRGFYQHQPHTAIKKLHWKNITLNRAFPFSPQNLMQCGMGGWKMWFLVPHSPTSVSKTCKDPRITTTFGSAIMLNYTTLQDSQVCHRRRRLDVVTVTIVMLKGVHPGFQHFSTPVFRLIITTSLYRLLPLYSVSKKSPTIFEQGYETFRHTGDRLP